MPNRLIAILALVTLALAACGDDDADNGAAPDPGDRTKPEVTSPGGEPPAELQTTDIIEGDGAEAEAGELVTVHYVGIRWSDGGEFDSSWDRDEPFQLILGQGMVIQGWEEGLLGMRVGGRREITIPPHLGYGDQGAGDVIPPGETLIFVVDLLEVLELDE